MLFFRFSNPMLEGIWNRTYVESVQLIMSEDFGIQERGSSPLEASRQPDTDERAAYERVLTDALKGDATLFARMDYVEEAWRIVDPVLAMNTPLSEYEPGSWGPADPAHELAPPGGWVDPAADEGAA